MPDAPTKVSRATMSTPSCTEVLYILRPLGYLELARYSTNGAACNGSEPGCKGYVIDPPAPAILLTPLVALFGPCLNQVPVSMAFGAAAVGLFWIATRQPGWNL